MRMTASNPNGLGAYPLAAYADCQALYSGPFEGSSVFVVDRLGEFEKLFPRTQLAEASTYARSVNRSIENIPTAALCQGAVESVYAPV
jgi:hypothetical protein